MLQNDIHRADAVRHMSVNAGTRTADRTDSHGHRPQNGLTCPNTQVTPLPRRLHPVGLGNAIRVVTCSFSSSARGSVTRSGVADEVFGGEIIPE